MAARGARALVLAMLISFLLVQGTLGEFRFRCCHCHAYRSCRLKYPNPGPEEDHCILKSFKDCRADFSRGCPKKGCRQRVDPDMGATFAAGGRNRSEADGIGEETAA